MARPRVENPNKPVSISFPKATLDLLDKYSKETNINRSTIVCEAIEALLFDHPKSDYAKEKFNVAGLEEVAEYLDYLGSDWLDAVEEGREEFEWPDKAKSETIVDEMIRPLCGVMHIPSAWEMYVPREVVDWVEIWLYPLENAFYSRHFFETEDWIKLTSQRLRTIIDKMSSIK
jgi:hypothetical protein